MEGLLSDWGGERLLVHHDHPSGAWILIGIHSSRLGPATGGTRMQCYPDLQAALADVLRLSAGMTYKYAVPGFPRGGGKAVIRVPADLEPGARGALLRRYGELIGELGGMFWTGPDVGTSSADMDVIAEAGAPYVFCRTPEAGGAGTSGPLTALGVYAGIRVACQEVLGRAQLDGVRVLVQGTGSVGGKLIEHLREAGAELCFSEVDERAIEHYRDQLGLRFVPSGEVCDTDCDVYAPCALGGVLDAETIPRLRCRIVAGGANNQLAEEADAERIRARGIFYAPDYVVNVGGALGITGIESMGWSEAQAAERVIESVREALLRILEMSEAQGISSEAAARRIAQERLSDST